MKLLFYNHTGTVSGAERVLLSVPAGLRQSGRDEVVLCCPAPSPLSEAAESAGVVCRPVEELRARFTWRPDRLARYLWSFVRVIRGFRAQVVAAQPDLIHANSVRAGLAATAATVGLGVPVVWHIHDVLPRHPLSVLIRCFALLSSRTRLLAVSHAVARRFRSRLLDALLHRPPVHVIHNGVDVARFHPSAVGRAAVRNELSLSESEFVMGSIGQITPRKGQLELIQAFAKAAEPHTRLLIVGAPLFDHDHEYAARVEREIERLGLTGRVRLLGKRRDVAAVLQSLDLVVVNSRSDPFPLVMLEAMACGVPVLACAVDGIPELIAHRETGWLIPPRDVEALAAGINVFQRLSPLRARLAANGRARVQADFTTQHFQNAMEDFLREACTAQPEVTQGKPARWAAPSRHHFGD